MTFSKIEIIDGKQYVKIEMLENEIAKNKDLQQRIDKAINYIKINVKNDWSIVDTSVVWYVLSILQSKEME